MENKEEFNPPKISININRKSFDAFMLAASAPFPILTNQMGQSSQPCINGGAIL